MHQTAVFKLLDDVCRVILPDCGERQVSYQEADMLYQRLIGSGYVAN